MQREEGKNLHKEQHFMGGCATGQDMISSKGLSKMKGKSIAVWWPGERCGAYQFTEASCTSARDEH